MAVSRRQENLWALSGVLFAVYFIVGEVLSGMLASSPLPLPGAPAAEAARYFTENRTAVLVLSLFQALSAVSLYVFVLCAVSLTGFVPGLGLHPARKVARLRLEHRRRSHADARQAA
jgi:hypothetical protein